MKKNDLIFIIAILVTLAVAAPLVLISRAPKDVSDDRAETADIVDLTPEPVLAAEVVSIADIVSEADAAEEKEDMPFFTTSEKPYFDDALFVGDSRTDELRLYGYLDNADYFCQTGMTVFGVLTEKEDVKGVGKVSLDELLAKKNYGKIYVMLGLNEIGYNKDKTIEKYSALLDHLQAAEPDAVIYILANLHVSKIHDAKSKYDKNVDIIELNRRMSELADHSRRRYYLDVNPLFCDGDCLRAELTGDGVHLYAKHSAEWCDWLRQNTLAE